MRKDLKSEEAENWTKLTRNRKAWYKIAGKIVINRILIKTRKLQIFVGYINLITVRLTV